MVDPNFQFPQNELFCLEFGALQWYGLKIGKENEFLQLDPILNKLSRCKEFVTVKAIWDLPVPSNMWKNRVTTPYVFGQTDALFDTDKEWSLQCSEAIIDISCVFLAIKNGKRVIVHSDGCLVLSGLLPCYYDIVTDSSHIIWITTKVQPMFPVPSKLLSATEICHLRSHLAMEYISTFQSDSGDNESRLIAVSPTERGRHDHALSLLWSTMTSDQRNMINSFRISLVENAKLYTRFMREYEILEDTLDFEDQPFGTVIMQPLILFYGIESDAVHKIVSEGFKSDRASLYANASHIIDNFTGDDVVICLAYPGHIREEEDEQIQRDSMSYLDNMVFEMSGRFILPLFVVQFD